MPRKLAKRITITAPASNVRTGAAVSIQSAYRKRRPYKKKGIYKNVSSNIQSIKVRVPFEIRRDEMTKNSADNSLRFSFVNSPWRNVSTTSQNRLFSNDFLLVMGLYQQYKLARVNYVIRRPLQYLSNSSVVAPTESFGTQVLHSRQVITANGTTNIVEGSTAITQSILLTEPTTWTEAVDNQSTTFHVHGYKRSCNRTWLPGSPFEKRWRNKNVTTDQELASGGLLLMIKSESIIPNAAGTPANAQIMFEGYADVFMNYCRRT